MGDQAELKEYLACPVKLKVQFIFRNYYFNLSTFNKDFFPKPLVCWVLLYMVKDTTVNEAWACSCIGKGLSVFSHVSVCLSHGSVELSLTEPSSLC